MVLFHNLNVPAVPKNFCGLANQRHQHVDAKAHVGGTEDETAGGKGVEFCELFFGEARGADDDGIAVLSGGAGRDHGGLGSREVYDHRAGTLRQHRGNIAGNQRAGSLEACEPVRGFRTFEHGGKDKIVRFFHEAGDGGTHAAGGTHDNDGKSHMISPVLGGMIRRT